MGKIILEEIEFFAYHGFYEEEQQTGGRFLVNLELDTSFEKACISDKLEDTFNYQIAYTIVQEEMQIKSSLLEHVASRIIDRLFAASAIIRSVKIKIAKMNPPLGGKAKAVSVVIKKDRKL
jgi:dihydroneopterin aldolase